MFRLSTNSLDKSFTFIAEAESTTKLSLKYSTVPSWTKNSSKFPPFFCIFIIPGLKKLLLKYDVLIHSYHLHTKGSVTIVALSEKIIFSGLMISSLKLSSIKLQHLLPFFQLFQLLLQLYPPYKRQLQVNDHTLLCIWHQNLLLLLPNLLSFPGEPVKTSATKNGCDKNL